jgi:hypothetical protein
VYWHRSLTTIALCVTGALPAAAQSAVGDSAKAAQRFVGAFYAWYAPVALTANREPGAMIALRRRRTALAPALAKALAADLAAQARVPGEIVGLDADPFLNSQDPCETATVGAALRDGGAFRVPVFAICGGTRTPQPVAFAKVQVVKGRWVIADIFGADNTTSLAATLQQLATERRAPGG